MLFRSFDFIFANKDSLQNNLGIHVIPIRVLLCLVSSYFICLIVLFKCLEISDLLIATFQKKSDVEILARSSVSPPLRVRTNYKVAASQ